MTTEDKCRQNATGEPWRLAKELYRVERAGERPEYLGGSQAFWRWLWNEINKAHALASRSPKKARHYASVNRETLDNHPGLAPSVAIGLRLKGQLWIDAATAEEERLGVDAQGQCDIFRRVS